MLDRLAPWARHLVLLCLISPLVAAVGVLSAAVLGAGGVHIDWAGTADSALDAAAVSAVGGLGTWIAMWITPLTRAYGRGSGDQVEP